MPVTESLFQINYLKGFLEGEWKLERRIEDRRSGEQGRLTGTAAFTAEDEALRYEEAGRLAIAGHEGPAEQIYRYVFDAPGRAAVQFRDGRFFHNLDLSRGRWTCTHLCAPDRYDGDFTAVDEDTWRVVWRVTGPRKDLILDSTYRRAL